MLIPLGRATPYPNGQPGFRFTCRHLQENGDCGIYEHRPTMCRDYPDKGVYSPDGRCEYPGCTWSAKRLGVPARLDEEAMLACREFEITGRGGYASVQQE